MSAGGNTIAFLSRADLDPSVGNSQQQVQLFVYDVVSGGVRQLTQMTFSNESLETFFALSHDASQVAVWVDTLVPVARKLRVIDTMAGNATDALTTASPTGGSADLVAFSRDDQQIIFSTDSNSDPLLFDPNGDPPRELFEYHRESGAVDQLTAFGNGRSVGSLAVAPNGRIAFSGWLTHSSLQRTTYDIDPEGANDDRSLEIYLLDPNVGGGRLKLGRGLISPSVPADHMTLKGLLVQPGGPPLDASTGEVSLTVLGADGQLFQATLPPGRMIRTASGWRYTNRFASDLRRLQLQTSDNVHYKFSASAQTAGLIAAATPYLTVEVRVGDAIFSNAQTFRQRGRRLVYP
jgi:hypothetical protein